MTRPQSWYRLLYLLAFTDQPGSLATSRPSPVPLTNAPRAVSPAIRGIPVSPPLDPCASSPSSPARLTQYVASPRECSFRQRLICIERFSIRFFKTTLNARACVWILMKGA